jgi:hypothetical protein
MGFFKRKKSKHSGEASASSPCVSTKTTTITRSQSNASQYLGHFGKAIYETNGRASVDSSQNNDSPSSDTSRSSTGLKLRFRKSFGNLFLEKNNSKASSPRMSHEVHNFYALTNF